MKDLIAHVIHFKMVMELVCVHKENRDAMFCKIFTSTFQDTTQKWFIELPLKSINNFFQLVKVIITNYDCNKPI